MILYAAFYNCDAVTDVFLPASVLSISSYAFQEKYQTVTDPETGRTDWSYYYTLTVHTPDGSNAGSFCITHGIPLTAE